MNREEALDTLALAYLVCAVDDPDSGSFSEALAAITVGDRAEILGRMERLSQRATRDFDEAVRALTTPSAR